MQQSTNLCINISGWIKESERVKSHTITAAVVFLVELTFI